MSDGLLPSEQAFCITKSRNEIPTEFVLSVVHGAAVQHGATVYCTVHNSDCAVIIKQLYCGAASIAVALGEHGDGQVNALISNSTVGAALLKPSLQSQIAQ